MKRILLLSIIIQCSLSVVAQTIKYPESVKVLYEQADKAAVLTKEVKPIIGIPSSENSNKYSDAVSKAGGIPLIIPQSNDAFSLREMAANLDGIVMLEGIDAKDESSVLLYKAASDRNVPLFGSCTLMTEINEGLRRDPEAINDFNDLIAKAKIYKQAKTIQSRLFSIDSHCDLPDIYSAGYSVGKRSNNQTSIQKMQEGGLDAAVLISYQWQGKMDDSSSLKAVKICTDMINDAKADVAANSEFAGLARNPQDALKLKEEGKKAFFIAIENGYGIGKDISNVDKYADMGVIYITLCHMKDNAICNTSDHRYSADTTKGLTPFGRKVVKEMNRKGIMVDVSHTSSGTFWDCIKYSKAPIICSHSGAKAVFNHDRNLTDDQLRALAAKGGVIQVYILSDFMGADMSKVNLDDVVNHIDHCVKIAGIDHVGIGADFDGGGGVLGCNGDNDLINLTVKLLERGYNEEQIAKLWGGNFLRVLGQVQAIK